jgi:putative hydrolase
MTPRQLLILAQLQSLMTLAEGYSNHVMNAVGAEILPNHAQIHERIEQRRRGRGPAELAFLRLTGLKMKMDQYALGERFADAVAAERGIDFLNLAWTQADNLPDEAEIRDWRLWVGRMDRARSTAIDVGAAG